MQQPDFNPYRPAQAWLVAFYGSLACANASRSELAAAIFWIIAVVVLALAIVGRFRRPRQ